MLISEFRKDFLEQIAAQSVTDGNFRRSAFVDARAGTGVPFLCTETHELGEEVVASYLYQIHLYHWLETNGYGRFLTDNDL